MRRAITLVELLVTIMVMMILAAVVLPRLQPAAKDRRLREAARMVDGFLGRARSQAIETGRPCGVMFQALDNPANETANSCAASKILFQVEVPPGYAGQSIDSQVTVQRVGAVVRAQSTNTGDFLGLVSGGDAVQFGHQGPWYQITAVVGDVLTASIPDSHITEIHGEKFFRVPWPESPAYLTVAFTVQRRPQPTIVPPLTLPIGTVVDLTASGLSQVTCASYFGEGDQQPVTILFSPNGSVTRYYCANASGTVSEVPSEPLFFLIGLESQVRRNHMQPNPNAPDDEKPNWQLPGSLWVAIAAQTGLVSVAEQVVPTTWYQNQTVLASGDPGFAPEYGIDEARGVAKESRSMGGR